MRRRRTAGGFPIAGGRILQRAQPRVRPADIEKLRVESVVAVRGENQLAVLRMNIRLGCGEKARADPHAARAQRHRGRNAAAIDDAAAGQHRQLAQDIDDLWHQRHGAHLTPDMASGFAALGHDKVEAGIGGPPGIGDRPDDLDRNRPGRLHARNIAGAIAPEKGNRAHAAFQRNGKPVLDREIQHEIGAVGFARELIHGGEQGFELIGIAPGAGEVSKAARIRDSSGQFRRSNPADRRLEYGVDQIKTA
jgi:hypothetical protein